MLRLFQESCAHRRLRGGSCEAGVVCPLRLHGASAPDGIRGRAGGWKLAANQLLGSVRSTVGCRLEKANASRACPVASLADSTVLASSSCLPGDRVPPKWRDGSMGWRLPGPFQGEARLHSLPVRGLRTIPRTTLRVGKVNAWVLTMERRLDSQTNRSD